MIITQRLCLSKYGQEFSVSGIPVIIALRILLIDYDLGVTPNFIAQC